MKLFLTGGTGFLGMNIFEQWKGSSYLYSRDEQLSSMVNYKPDYIIHAAAEIHEEGMMISSNIDLTHSLLERAKGMKNLKAFIYIGSSSEYGLKDHAISEDEVLEPFHLYAATKGAGSLICQSFVRDGVPVMIARPFSLYGKHEPKERLIPTAIKAAKAGWELKIGPGHHDFIHVDDFIRGLFMMLKKPMPGEIFNFGTGEQLSNFQVVDIIERAVGRNALRVAVGKMRDYDTDMWVCDNKKAYKLLGWKPKITFEEGIGELCLT